jgi:hypothetical protein
MLLVGVVVSMIHMVSATLYVMTCQNGTDLGVCIIDNWQVKIQKQQNDFVNGSYSFVDGNDNDWALNISGTVSHLKPDTDYKDGRLAGSYFRNGSDAQSMIDMAYGYCTSWCAKNVTYQDIFPCIGSPNGVNASICGISEDEFKAYNPNGASCCTKPYYGPKKDGTCHTAVVSEGDTCASIASWYGVTVSNITQWNNGNTTCKIGDTICVSDGKSPQQKTCNNINNNTKIGVIDTVTGTTGAFLELTGYIYDGKNHTCTSNDGRYVNCDDLSFDLQGTKVVNNKTSCQYCVNVTQKNIECKDYCNEYVLTKINCSNQ